jgi:transducin (beta)-like 1
MAFECQSRWNSLCVGRCNTKIADAVQSPHQYAFFPTTIKAISLQIAGCLDVDWLDESTFATCSANRAIHLVSLSSKQAIRTFVSVLSFPTITQGIKKGMHLSGHTNEVNQVKFNKHKTILASCSDDFTARIWLSEAWTSPDGSIAAPDPSITDAELASKYPAKFVLSGHTNSVGAIRWCPTENGDTETLLATYVILTCRY